MKKDGYDAPFAAALTAATSTVGPIVPPSIPLVTYAMLSGASIGALFLGGILPGIVLSGLMAVYVNIVARKRQYPRGNKYTVKTFLVRTFRAIPAMLTPVILFIGIYGGVITPTEAGAIASLWALLIALFVYRSMTFKQVLLALRNTALQTGVITIMTTASFVMSYLVAAEGISTAIANWVLNITSNKYVLLLVINCVFLILGMVIDVSVMMYVFVPLVLPIITACGISLVHFGVMITLNMMIGLSTPPFGMCLFVGSSISGAKVSDISKKILPMCIVLIASLLLITYIPAIVTWLPGVCGY